MNPFFILISLLSDWGIANVSFSSFVFDWKQSRIGIIFYFLLRLFLLWSIDIRNIFFFNLLLNLFFLFLFWIFTFRDDSSLKPLQNGIPVFIFLPSISGENILSLDSFALTFIFFGTFHFLSFLCRIIIQKCRFQYSYLICYFSDNQLNLHLFCFAWWWWHHQTD